MPQYRFFYSQISNITRQKYKYHYLIRFFRGGRISSACLSIKSTRQKSFMKTLVSLFISGGNNSHWSLLARVDCNQAIGLHGHINPGPLIDPSHQPKTLGQVTQATRPGDQAHAQIFQAETMPRFSWIPPLSINHF